MACSLWTYGGATALLLLHAGCAEVLGLSDYGNCGEDGAAACPLTTTSASTGTGTGGGGGGCVGPCEKGDALWGVAFGDAPDQAALGVATDSADNVLVVGAFQGTVKLGSTTLSSAGGDDVLVAKFGPTGDVIRAVKFGDSNGQRGLAVVGGAGGVTLGGEFSGTLSATSPPLSSSGAIDGFVATLDANLAPGAGVALRGPGNQRVTALASLGTDVIAVGRFDQQIDFGSGSVPSAGAEDFFVARISGDSVVWSKTFGSSGVDVARGVSVDASGRIAVIGTFEGTVDFGDGPRTSAGLGDVFVLTLDAGGMTPRSARFGDADEQTGVDCAWGAAGKLAIGGNFAGGINFGGGTSQSAGLTDVFIALLDSTGMEEWHVRSGDSGKQTLASLAVDGSGAVVVTGSFQGSLDFGGGAITSIDATQPDAFVAKLTAGGAPIWARAVGDAGASQDPLAVAVDSQGRALLTGSFAGKLDFGPNASLSSAGQADGFVVQLK